MRYTGKPIHIPTALTVRKKAVAVTFTHPLDRDSVSNLENYTIRRWNYKWTARYGSDLFKLDGTEGTEPVSLSGVSLSRDGKTVELSIDDLKEVMQMQLNFNIRAADGTRIEQTIYHTINTLSETPGKPVTATFR